MKKTKKSKIIIGSIIICIIIGMLIWLFMEIYLEIRINKKETSEGYNVQNINTQNLSLQIEEQKETTQIKKEYPKEKIIDEYRGYKVAAKLEIPKIQLETYILQKYSLEALNVSVTKFWGANPNEIGNFCVAGHNFKNKNMFRNLKKLQDGDKIYISDNNIGKIEYVIYDVYKVDPKDVSCLNQATDGKREVTLITCTNDSKKRIIVKARE